MLDGGGSYHEDVSEERTSRTQEHFNYRGHEGGDSESASTARREVHDDLNIKGKKREASDSTEHPKTTPIVVAMDVTASRGDDAKVIYEKLPMLMGQLYMKGYVPDPTVSFCAIGDATSGDFAPIQVGQFESDERLDAILGKMWLEEGGGGTGQESYELLAYYFAKHAKLDVNKRGKKGLFFFVGDEGFYPKVAKDQIKSFIGDDVAEDISSAKVFADLQKNFHVFLIFPKKTAAERRSNIDAEIRRRVTEAGGMYDDVDVRASLMWYNHNDLDLHIITPTGLEIFYGNKKVGHGELDVDMNAGGPVSMKPVENIRWPKGKAPKGAYKVFVRNYATHGFPAKTPFKVELEVNGKVLHFEGETPTGRTGPSSDVTAFEFSYDPNERQVAEEAYAKYDDTLITNQWGSVIPPENILKIEDPKAIVDVILGAIAIQSGNDLDSYVIDMQGREQTQKRIGDVRKALGQFAHGSTTAVAKVNKTDDTGADKKSKSKRI